MLYAPIISPIVFPKTENKEKRTDAKILHVQSKTMNPLD